jgi:hypothetical protein
MGWMGIKYKIVVVKPEDKRPLGRPRRRWQDNLQPVEKDLRVSGVLNWLRIGSSDSFCGHDNETSDSIKDGNFLTGLAQCIYEIVTHYERIRRLQHRKVERDKM